jgi:YggT family protein
MSMTAWRSALSRHFGSILRARDSETALAADAQIEDTTTMAETILQIILTLLNILTFALIGRALLSWFDPMGQWTISRILADITDPIIAPLRRVIPPIGMIDISFIVAIILIQVLERLLRQALI